MQDAAAPAYEPNEALERGTLFPGLDLPFMNLVNDSVADVPTAELMAIDFVADELELYLDTHADDREAFALYQSFLALGREARERYVARYGAVAQCDQLGMASYGWLRDPWPWEFQNRRER
jgi:spore coat protein JB